MFPSFMWNNYVIVAKAQRVSFFGKNPMMTGMHVLSACDPNTEMVVINFVLVQWIVDAVSITARSDSNNCDAS